MSYHESMGVSGYFFPCTIDGVTINPRIYRMLWREISAIDEPFKQAAIRCLAIFERIYPLVKKLDELDLAYNNADPHGPWRRGLIDLGASYATNEPDYMKELDKLRMDSSINLPWSIDYLVDVSRSYFRQHEKPKLADKAGYVYLLRSVSGYYKIGRAKDPEARLRTFEVKLPFEVEFEHVINARDYVAAEAELHERYADCRVNGEWFSLTPEDISEIRAIKDM